MLGSIGLVLAITGLALAAGPDPQNPYAPWTAKCPTTLVTRTGSPSNGNQRLAKGEASYLKQRRQDITPPIWDSYLRDDNTGTTGYDVGLLLKNASTQGPRISTACSGGGYRAALYCAGSLSVFDGRDDSRIAPLLQLADYISGLSGGSWTVSSLMQNNLPTLYDLVLGSGGQQGWHINYGLFKPSATNFFDDTHESGGNSAYEDDMCRDVKEKALSYHLFNGTTASNFYDNDTPNAHASGLLWSSLKLTTNYSEFKSPIPIVVTTSRVNEDDPVTPRNTQFEFTPYTFGSYDPSLMATVPVEFAGTHANNGVPSNGCVRGFENAGFVVGSSSAMFNRLTDGYEDGENIPLAPLLVKARAQDLILALDASADVGGILDEAYTGYPDGTSLIATANRIATYFRSFTSFPPIPSSTDDFTDNDSWISPDIALTQRPTFFGCNTRGNGSMSSPDSYPIIVYLPNAGSNLDATTGYTEDTIHRATDFLDLARANAMKGYGDGEKAKDDNWPLALKCALVDRARKRAGMVRSQACKVQFEKCKSRFLICAPARRKRSGARIARDDS
ncbi:hypothetical protein RQP46_007457 [Phenoliferia psychrophenolica]